MKNKWQWDGMMAMDIGRPIMALWDNSAGKDASPVMSVFNGEIQIPDPCNAAVIEFAPSLQRQLHLCVRSLKVCKNNLSTFLDDTDEKQDILRMLASCIDDAEIALLASKGDDVSMMLLRE